MYEDTPEVPEVLEEKSLIDQSKAWRMYVDGAKKKLGAIVGVVLTSPKGVVLEYYLRLNFPTTNNEVEYEAFTAGLRSSRSC